MSLSVSQFTEAGANPFAVDGPVSGVTGTSIPLPQIKPGTTAIGDCEATYVYAKLVLASTTTLVPGQAYTFDRDYTASLLTTTNSPRGQSVGVGRVAAVLVAGAYYLWLQIKGHAPVVATGSGNALAETTATGGTVNFNNTPTATSKAIVGLYLFQTNFTFTATTVSGSPILTKVSSQENLTVGATVTGTGVAGLIVSSINSDGTITLSGNASANGTAVTMTVTGDLPANLLEPYIDKTN
jgi:hypothetical protein